MVAILSNPARALRSALALSPLALLGGCDWVVMNPAGDVARQQADLVIVATVLMLLIIVPVMALTIWFAWHYRAANQDARYEPDWHHSTQLELVIWSAPLLIIIALGAVTWAGTHLLDPYRTIGRIDAGKAVSATVKPLEVNVVALDWKWLFIYPEQKIATVNELVLPTDRPIKFRITSSSVMNSFYAPALAGQIYAMPGMETKLHAVLNREGLYAGFSANYSGAGFSHMRFAMRGLSAQGFDQWAAGVRAESGLLDRAAYLELEKPSEQEAVRHYAAVAPDLFDAVVNLCVRPGKMCMSQMMALDARGGTGKAGGFNTAALTYDKFGREHVANVAPGALLAAEKWVKAMCADNSPTAALSQEWRAPASVSPLRGAGIARPAQSRPTDTLSLAPAALDRAAKSPLS
ncbi:cytochrome o ubiquinol oxidase subunit 2 [Sphingobium fontiphilum]|uniref:Ubiquinol oxidase polypeptide II n=1 Tax=Sphingobium fontiphilum TaxID=944425 RepID=A0A7W6DFC5_9SPHN|nr:ubiquinol oxidase subunit II [Sphingobium fontiphilum]MBB3982073.1 cytochrome o ubiquinol oxidase subunit 2 [Sphingobium fontiphilum]